MYRGLWAERVAAAVQAEGGKMTVEDLAAYEVIWDEPLRAPLGDYEIVTNRPPNNGGVAMIEAYNVALASGMVDDGTWWESADALRKALDSTQLGFINFLPAETLAAVYPGLEITSESRVTPEYAAEMWARMDAGAKLTQWAPAPEPRHSDDVVVIDAEGNIAAITHSINAVLWGKTAIVVDGITIGDPASFQQAQIAATQPGGRLASPTETGVLFRDGQAVLGFASMGSGLHQRTFLGLMGVTQYGFTVDEAINAPDFFYPRIDPTTFQTTFRVIEGGFPSEVLDGTGYAYEEVELGQVRFGGEGIWVAISRDPETGELRAASHNRNNSAAVAF
jgi:gamma-glutamyltranspeptidase/glutathione hydrolase